MPSGQRAVVRDDELEPGLARLGDLPVRGRPHDDDPRGRELAAAGRAPPPTVATQSAGRARAERAVGDVDRAVPVAVRLDDGPELGARELLEQQLGVPPHRAEVDRDLRARYSASSSVASSDT